MRYRVIELPPLVLSPNNFYLYYNDEGDITALTNEKLEQGTYIQVSEKFVIDFVESKKEIKNFKIRVTDQVQLEHKNTFVKNFYNYLVLYSMPDAKCTVTITKKSLKFKINNFEKTGKLNDKKIYMFSIVDQQNLNFLKSTVFFSLKELVKGVKFDYKFDVKSEIIVSSGEFESYGLIYDKKN